MKKLLKVSLYFSFSGIEKCPNVHFLGKIYTFLIKIGTIGGVKSIKIYTFEISHLSYFFPSILPLNISEFLNKMASLVGLFLCKLFNHWLIRRFFPKQVALKILLTHFLRRKILKNKIWPKKFQIFNLLHIEHAPWRFWYFVKLKASAQKCLFHLMIFWRKFAVALCLVERNRPFRANLSVCLLFWLIKGLKC